MSNRTRKAAELDRRLLHAAVAQDHRRVRAIGREAAQTLTTYELADAVCRLALAAGAFARLVPAGERAQAVSTLTNAEALIAIAGAKNR